MSLPVEESSETLEGSKQRTRSSGGSPSFQFFPTILHKMLCKAESLGYDQICSWLPHGQSFRIHDREKFVVDVMPQYFKQTVYSSFQRQLNLYGFTRIARRGPDYQSYYHENFIRGQPELAETIQRVKPEEEKARKAKPDPIFTLEPSLDQQQLLLQQQRRKPMPTHIGILPHPGAPAKAEVVMTTPKPFIAASLHALSENEYSTWAGAAANPSVGSLENMYGTIRASHQPLESSASSTSAAPEVDIFDALEAFTKRSWQQEQDERPSTKRRSLTSESTIQPQGHLEELHRMVQFLDDVDLDSSSNEGSEGHKESV